MQKLKKTVSFLIIFLIAAAQFAAFAPSAQACSCEAPDPNTQKMVQKAWADYDAIFSGTVISTVIDDSVANIDYKKQTLVTAIDVWKGDASKNNTISIRTSYGDECGYGFEIGEQYLIYAWKNPETGYLATGLCTPTKKLTKASEEIPYLNKLAIENASPGFNVEKPILPPISEKPSMPPGGTLNVITQEGEDTKEFPLKHTDVQAEISGHISRVVVTQEFVNPYTEPIEAVYTFPLPQNAAVDAMEMKIGKRVIRAQIKTRDEARQLYKEANASPQPTSPPIEQERPNVFTQSVANILPGDTILITIQYIETLEYERGTYTFVFPMTVGPRYIPFGGVPDAERITPPVLKPGERSGHDISLTMEINAGFPIKDIRSKNHSILPTEIGLTPLGEIPQPSTNATVTLSPFDSIPNKDFVLEYDVGGDEPQFTLLTHKKAEDDHGYFLLIVLPQLTPAPIVSVVEPVLTDISITTRWDGFSGSGIMETYPNPLPDLFASKPLYLYGQYAPGKIFIEINGKMSNEKFSKTLEINLPETAEQNEGLASIWARQKVKALEASMYGGENPQTVEEITNLALAYNIVTKYTSFVAFEEKPVAGETGKTVQVPVELPEGASYEGIFGEVAQEAPSAIGGGGQTQGYTGSSGCPVGTYYETSNGRCERDVAIASVEEIDLGIEDPYQITRLAIIVASIFIAVVIVVIAIIIRVIHKHKKVKPTLQPPPSETEPPHLHN